MEEQYLFEIYHNPLHLTSNFGPGLLLYHRHMISRFLVLFLLLLSIDSAFTSTTSYNKRTLKLRDNNKKRHDFCKRILKTLLERYREQVNPEAKIIPWARIKVFNFPKDLEKKGTDRWSVTDLTAIEKVIPIISFIEPENEPAAPVAIEPKREPLQRKRERSTVPRQESVRVTRRNAGDFEEFTLPQTSSKPCREVRMLLKASEAFKKPRLGVEDLSDESHDSLLNSYSADDEDSGSSVEDLIVLEDFDPTFDEVAHIDEQFVDFDVSDWVWEKN